MKHIDKGNLVNVPPHSYCNTYSSLPESFDIDNTEYPYRALLDAANLTPARCSITGFTIITPLQPLAWAHRLAATRYPFPAAAVALVSCLRLGVDLGFKGDRTPVHVGPNLESAQQHPQAIHENIVVETNNGKRKGPFSYVPFPYFYSNPLGVVFKKGKSKPRVIHHLSWPRSTANSSVNASITDFNVKLDAFDRAVVMARQLGKGAFMSKIDIESAYRCIPVRPVDWPLLGMSWNNQFYFDIVMQFGITSATAIFEWYSSAAQYIVEKSCGISNIVHYIDDFFTLVNGLAAAKHALKNILAVFAELGLPVSLSKLEGPATTMVFLGILFDTVTMTIRLDEERMANLLKELSLWNDRTSASREELQSLVGVLSFAAKVVAPGRTFLRRMIDHIKALPANTDATSQQPLSESFDKDLQWWRRFLSQWNGISLIPDTNWTPSHAMSIYTDACVQGYGGMFGSHWFAAQWTTEEQQMAARDKRDSMPFKELYALTRAAATWGSHWRGRKILFHCDCDPIVKAWRKGDSNKPHISHLIRTLLFIAATHDFNLNVVHIAGVDNVCADLLSRGQVTAFLELPGQHDPLPTTLLPLPIQTW